MEWLHCTWPLPLGFYYKSKEERANERTSESTKCYWFLVLEGRIAARNKLRKNHFQPIFVRSVRQKLCTCGWTYSLIFWHSHILWLSLSLSPSLCVCFYVYQYCGFKINLIGFFFRGKIYILSKGLSYSQYESDVTAEIVIESKIPNKHTNTEEKKLVNASRAQIKYAWSKRVALFFLSRSVENEQKN